MVALPVQGPLMWPLSEPGTGYSRSIRTSSSRTLTTMMMMEMTEKKRTERQLISQPC